jgi:hypothetical protein
MAGRRSAEKRFSECGSFVLLAVALLFITTAPVQGETVHLSKTTLISDTLEPGEKNVYLITTVVEDESFGFSPERGYISLHGGLKSFGRFEIYLVQGHFENGSVEHLNSSSEEFILKYNGTSISLQHMLNESDERMTLVVTPQGNTTISYEFLVTLEDGNVSSWLKWAFLGAGSILAVTIPYGVWRYRNRAKHRFSSRGVEHTPQGLTERWLKSLPRYESGMWSHGSFQGKSKLQSVRGETYAICPFCHEILGTAENRYAFNFIRFVDIGASSGRQRGWASLAVYCTKCEKHIGIVKQ